MDYLDNYFRHQCASYCWNCSNNYKKNTLVDNRPQGFLFAKKGIDISVNSFFN